MEARLLPSPSKRRRTNLAPSEPQRTSQQTQLHTTSLLPQKRSQPAPAKPAPSRKITLEHPPPPPPDHEQAAAQLRSRISTEEAEIAALTRQLEKENRRIALISVERRREDEAQDLIDKLLADNDATYTHLPAAPTFSFSAAIADPDIPSCLPLPVSDPLPHLTAFQSLGFTHVDVVALPSLARKHTVVGTASGKKQLHFRFEMVVDTAAEVVVALECRTSPWARGELAGVLRECCDARDPQMLLYAIDSYQRMCGVRAKSWRRLAAAFPGLLGEGGRGTGLGRWWGTGVLRFRGPGVVGKRGRVVDAEGPELVVSWRIGVDWVGEAESVVDAAVRVPGAWAAVDAHDQLRKAPLLFQDLLRERGVYDAARCMVELLFPGEKAKS